ncbi:hypothetical protein LINGRAHAP2_LOCUS12693 [Linum grandiflorum]
MSYHLIKNTISRNSNP